MKIFVNFYLSKIILSFVGQKWPKMDQKKRDYTVKYNSSVI